MISFSCPMGRGACLFETYVYACCGGVFLKQFFYSQIMLIFHRKAYMRKQSYSVKCGWIFELFIDFFLVAK